MSKIKLIMSDLPDGPLRRYIRDVYAMSNSEDTFDNFEKQWLENYDKECKQRNIDHPIEFDKTIKIGQTKTIHFFKRYKEEWLCSECDMAPYGGSGQISLEEALIKCGKTNISEI